MSRTLSLLSEVEFKHRVSDGYPVTCPTLDLSTTWDNSGKNVYIIRPPGQIVSKIHQAGRLGVKPPEAVSTAWKADGQFLAIGWSDGVVRLMGLESNKTAHHIDICSGTEARIVHIGWACSKTSTDDDKETYSRSPEKKTKDLPRELMYLEVEAALPKISPLPSSSAGPGEDATVFTLRTSIDFLFQTPRHEDYDFVNVMIVGTDDGRIHLNICDSFAIGSFPCPSSSLAPYTSQLLKHTSNPQISTHTLLVADKLKKPSQVDLIPTDLPFLSSSPINLSFLTTKLTTMQKLLRYLKQTQLHMQTEWKNTRELPGKFLRSVEEDLKESDTGPRSIVPALYHTVVTGHAYEPVREWLVDSLAERGHKRWDKAVVSGLEGLRSLIHENFLPVLERCSIILSRLRGLALFYNAKEEIGFSAVQITKIMDIFSCLTLIGHKILLLVMDELEHFTVFSSWLRSQIDRLATSSSESEELSEKEATTDIGKVLTYIEQYLASSPLHTYLDEISKEDFTADWEHIDSGVNLLDTVSAQVKKHEKGQEAMKALPHVEFLVDYATHWSSKVFEHIAETKRRSVRFGKPISLSIDQPIDVYDCRIVEADGEDAIVFVALASEDSKSKLTIFRTQLDIVNGISRNMPTSRCLIDLGDRTLADFAFIDDTSLILLCKESDATPVLVSVPFRQHTIQYSPYDPNNTSEISHVPSDEFPSFTLPEEQQAMSPMRMEVLDSSDIHGDIPKRICLLESNLSTLRTFTLPGEESI
ncbi:unnamed protein product [Clonostachys chloroleuca]|uniref:Anaphase-promoting complex subunit 4 n=1 Tax=Clonostachys chloroleuca TaxID=1926264 RepID=A0AA35PWV0_9HYPO|nr:unnamed protein product [Clonostachys chloroleuca]